MILKLFSKRGFRVFGGLKKRLTLIENLDFGSRQLVASATLATGWRGLNSGGEGERKLRKTRKDAKRGREKGGGGKKRGPRSEVRGLWGGQETGASQLG